MAEITAVSPCLGAMIGRRKHLENIDMQSQRVKCLAVLFVTLSRGTQHREKMQVETLTLPPYFTMCGKSGMFSQPVLTVKMNQWNEWSIVGFTRHINPKGNSQIYTSVMRSWCFLFKTMLNHQGLKTMIA